MIRRKFLKTSLSSIFLSGMVNKISFLGISFLDPYGGWKGKKFRASGFFRVEKDDRWWLVSPEGNAFLSFGINHFHAGWWKQPCVGFHLCGAYQRNKARRYGLLDEQEQPDQKNVALIQRANQQIQQWMLEHFD